MPISPWNILGLIFSAFLLPGTPALPGYCVPVRAYNAESEYAWTRLTPAAAFARGYNFQLFTHGKRLYAFHSDGVWVSSDGRAWKKTELTNIVGNQAFLDYVVFEEAVYALGTFAGNIQQFTQTAQIARTTDFKGWQILSVESDLPRRFFCHPFVFQNTLWIIGGEDSAGRHDDGWASTDAVHWTKVAENLPFGNRSGQRFVVFKEKLYMLDRDVWVSSDGLRWTMLTPEIAEGEIFGYSPEVFDGKIWLIGCSRSGTFRNEVLSSSDGIHWTAERAPWSPRGGAATCVFNGQIIMTGGKYGGPGIAGQTEFVYSNDVWGMKKR